VARTVRPWARRLSVPLARTIHPLTEPPIDRAYTFQVIILLFLEFFIFYFNGFGGLKKKLAGRFLSKRRRADDSDYIPTTDSEAQSSAGGSVPLDAKDAPQCLFGF
jgi:hypothetical protein